MFRQSDSPCSYSQIMQNLPFVALLVSALFIIVSVGFSLCVVVPPILTDAVDTLVDESAAVLTDGDLITATPLRSVLFVGAIVTS